MSPGANEASIAIQRMKDEQIDLLKQSQSLAEEAQAAHPSASASSGHAADKTAAERLIANIPVIKAALEKVSDRFRFRGLCVMDALKAYDTFGSEVNGRT